VSRDFSQNLACTPVTRSVVYEARDFALLPQLACSVHCAERHVSLNKHCLISQFRGADAEALGVSKCFSFVPTCVTVRAATYVYVRRRSKTCRPFQQELSSLALNRSFQPEFGMLNTILLSNVLPMGGLLSRFRCRWYDHNYMLWCLYGCPVFQRSEVLKLMCSCSMHVNSLIMG